MLVKLDHVPKVWGEHFKKSNKSNHQPILLDGEIWLVFFCVLNVLSRRSSWFSLKLEYRNQSLWCVFVGNHLDLFNMLEVKVMNVQLFQLSTCLTTQESNFLGTQWDPCTRWDYSSPLNWKAMRAWRRFLTHIRALVFCTNFCDEKQIRCKFNDLWPNGIWWRWTLNFSFLMVAWNFAEVGTIATTPGCPGKISSAQSSILT